MVLHLELCHCLCTCFSDLMQLIGCAKQEEQFSAGFLIGFVIKEIKGKNNN